MLCKCCKCILFLDFTKKTVFNHIVILQLLKRYWKNMLRLTTAPVHVYSCKCYSLYN